MVNELRQLLDETAGTSPYGDAEVAAVLRGGRRRVRRRQLFAVGGAALATVAVVGLTSVVWPSPRDAGVAGVPEPDAPTITLADAREAVRGEDYRLLTSYTNDNLDRANGTYLSGVTDDGLVVLRDGPHGIDNRERWGLLDPATDETTWLPGVDAAADELRPLELGRDRLLFLGGLYGNDMKMRLAVYWFDRDRERWSAMKWPDLPLVDYPSGELGPDGRLYVRVPATQGEPPPGGWPTQAGGDAEDADAEGDTYRLWSVDPTDGTDVRDEGLTVGDVAFTEDAMVWTDRTNGDAGQVHVRDLATGEEHAFDPESGERCNLLSFGAAGDRVVMSQYCGTYGTVRDDRVQVVDLDGDQVVTLQDDGADGGLASPEGDGLVLVQSHDERAGGSYVYDLADDRFLRLSDAVSKFALGGGPLREGELMWDTPVNRGHGATQWLAELTD